VTWFNLGPIWAQKDLLKKQYEEKKMAPEDAVQCLQSGFNVVVPLGCGEPHCLLEAMVERRQELKDVRVHQMLPLSLPTYLKPGMDKHFRHVTWFPNGVLRPGVQAGQAGVMPGYFREYPRFFEEHVTVDVFMGVVSPMDRHGFFSFGVSVDYTTTAARKANTVILVVNPNMPRTHGAGFIHLCQADIIVEDTSPLPEVTFDPPQPEDEIIAAQIAELVPDGATIQLGLGTIPNAVAAALRSKKGLGVHTEIITDAFVDLVEAGAITNRYKTLHPGKMVCTAAVGTRRLYDFLDDNPMIEMRPVSYTNDPQIISLNANMVAITSAAEMDLLGQCTAETIGPKSLAGTGGQVDFARGTAMAPGGKFIVALRSTNPKGQSNIVPQLRQGAVVSIGKNDVDYVVTEYGAARLRGRTVRQRAEALIALAHPKYRDGLREAAKKLGYTR